MGSYLWVVTRSGRYAIGAAQRLTRHAKHRPVRWRAIEKAKLAAWGREVGHLPRKHKRHG